MIDELINVPDAAVSVVVGGVSFSICSGHRPKSIGEAKMTVV